MPDRMNHNSVLRRARLQALAVPVLYAVCGCMWILVSDLALESLALGPRITTRIAMVKGWIFVAGSTVLIVAVMRKAWSTIENAYLDLESELAQRRKAQEETSRLAAELEQRVEERTRHLQAAISELAMFSDSVSHDLRAPLRIVAGYARTLLEDHSSQLSLEGLAHLGRLSATAGKMERMVGALLELSRHGRTSVRLERFEAGRHQAMVDEIWHEVRQGYPDREFHFERGDLPAIQCDPSLVEHVWRNTLSNAAKYTRGRNPANIRVEFSDGWFRVVDNGVGFEPSSAKRIFRPFERLHRAEEFEGDGIGLALAAQVVTRHGGEIEADSRPGAGTEIRFRIP